MKKTLLTLASILMMGIAVNAQSDSTVNTPDQMVQPADEANDGQSTAPNRVRVQANDLPPSLKQTLGGSEYKGWENAPIYKNNTTNQYSFSLPNNGASKTYTFDQSGQPIQGAGSSSSVSSTQTTSQNNGDNTSTYSSKKTTNSSTTGKQSSTKGHKSGTMKKPVNNASSTTTTNTSSSSSSTMPAK